MTLPRFTTDMGMITGGEAIFGSQYHPLIQMSFTSIDDYATSLGLDVSYTSMPFVLDPNGTTALPIPGDESCIMGTDNATCVMGSDFHSPFDCWFNGTNNGRSWFRSKFIHSYAVVY